MRIYRVPAPVELLLVILVVLVLPIIVCLIGHAIQMRRIRGGGKKEIATTITLNSETIDEVNVRKWDSWKKGGKYRFVYYHVDMKERDSSFGIYYNPKTDDTPHVCIINWYRDMMRYSMQDVITLYNIAKQDFNDLRLTTMIGILWNFITPCEPKSLRKYDVHEVYEMYNLALTQSSTHDIEHEPTNADRNEWISSLEWGDSGVFEIRRRISDKDITRKLKLSDYFYVYKVFITDMELIRPRNYEAKKQYLDFKRSDKEDFKFDYEFKVPEQDTKYNFDDIVKMRQL